ncbi:MAG TPA: DUF3466 family protein [Gemmatales bacterium]|nr:DUF3466 family protein [Gemmatales bacterium]HMP57893.1 DUF3466 family protein [Gemmatales bacterium]
MMKHVRVTLALIVWALVVSAAPAQQYTLIDLGVFPTGNESRAAALNASGLVTGAAGITTDFPPDYRAYIWQSGVMSLFGTPPDSMVPGSGGTASEGRSINVHGHVVGLTNQFTGTSYVTRGFYFDGTNNVFVPLLPGGGTNVANDINASGIVVGYSNLAADPAMPPYVAFRWDANSAAPPTQLPTFYGGANSTIANGLNDGGRIVGTGEFDANGRQRAFIWDNGDANLTAIPVLPPINASDPNTFNNFANKVNVHGNVVGVSDVSDFFGTGIFQQNAFLYISATNTLIDIGTLGGNLGEGRGINSLNDVVGFSNDVENGVDIAFIWTQSGGIVDLNTLLDSTGDGWFLERAEAINDEGWIVGFGIAPNGDTHAYLLRPAAIPEPATWALLGTLAMGGAAGYWHRRREARLVQDEDSGEVTLANSPPSGSSNG